MKLPRWLCLAFMLPYLYGCQQMILESQLIIDTSSDQAIFFENIGQKENADGTNTIDYALDAFDLVTKQKSRVVTMLNAGYVQGYLLTYNSITQSHIYYLVDSEIIEVDLNTQQQRVVSSATKGTGPIWRRGALWDKAYKDMIFDPPNNRLLLLTRIDSINQHPHGGFFLTDAIIAIDIASGDRRSIVRDDDQTSPPILSKAELLEIDVFTNSIFILGWDNLLRLDPNVGSREIVSSVDKGIGPALFGRDFSLYADHRLVSGIAYDAENNRMLALNGRDRIFAIDVTSGDRTVVSSPRVGSGPNLCLPTAIAIDKRDNTIYVLDGLFSTRIFTIAPITGNRSVNAPAACVVEESTTIVGRALINYMNGMWMLFTVLSLF